MMSDITSLFLCTPAAQPLPCHSPALSRLARNQHYNVHCSHIKQMLTFNSLHFPSWCRGAVSLPFLIITAWGWRQMNKLWSSSFHFKPFILSTWNTYQQVNCQGRLPVTWFAQLARSVLFWMSGGSCSFAARLLIICRSCRLLGRTTRSLSNVQVTQFDEIFLNCRNHTICWSAAQA